MLSAVATLAFFGLAGAMETHSLSLIGFDAAIRMGLHSFSSPPLTLLAEKGTWLGSLGVIGLFSVLAFVVMVHSGDRRGAVILTVTMIGALVLENGLKFSFQRVRPTPFFGSEPLTYSFPSGHALFSLCFYGAIAITAARLVQPAAIKILIWLAMTLLVSAIGITRIYLGVHYPSDVLGGYLVAIAWVAVVMAAEQRARSSE